MNWTLQPHLSPQFQSRIPFSRSWSSVSLVISKISEINDEAFLAAINTILDSKSESVENYNLDLKKSEDDIAQGNVSTHNQVLEKIAQWKKR